jgi:hypothetical protein
MAWAILHDMCGDLSLVVVSLRPRFSALAGLLTLLVGVVGVGCDPSQVGPPDVAPCSISQPCGDGLVCADGNCVAACTLDSCGAAGFCDEATGVCVQCRDNVDCGPGLVCNAFTRQCTGDVAGCTQNSDCDRGFCDVSKGSCVECLQTSDCGEGQRCDDLTRSCITDQGCTSDFNCSGTTPVCELSTQVCVQCFVDAHCASGSCDTLSKTCLASCVDGDETEPNSALQGGSPAAIVTGSEHSGSICPADVDEFSFSGEGAISASLIVDGGRLTLTLLNSQGTVLATGATSVSVPTAPAGAFRLRVEGADADVEADYLLRLTVVPPAVCTEIDAEPNNASFAAIDLPTNGTARSGTVCGDDVDFWKVSTAAGDDVSVSLVPGTGAGVAAITLESISGTVLGSGTAAAPATITGAAGGDVFVRVRATGGDVDYSLRATVSSAPPQCVQTDPEPNDQPAQAPAVASATLLTGQICAADVDQWRFNAAALDDVVVALTGSNVRARVFDASGAVVGEGTTTFTITDVDAGAYRVEVRGALSSTEAAYTLRVTLTPEPVADPCTEGGLEPDAFGSPRVVAADGSVAAGRICADDADFFRFTIGAASSVGISVRFVDDDGDLDVRLSDSTGQITTSAGVSDEELIIRDLAAGSYTVEVFGFSGAINTYTVAVSTVSCTEDAFEPNNSMTRATPVASAAIAAVRCPTNDDFYAIRLESGDVLDANLVGSGLTLSLLSSAGAVLQSDEANGQNRRLQASSLPPGRYGLRVTGSGVNATSYTLTPTITPTPARCVDDGAELNNATDAAFALDASVLADGSYALSKLVMCDGVVNVDFFAIDVPANRTLRVALSHATTADLDIEVLEQRGQSGLYRSIARAVSLAGTLDVVQGQVNAATRFLIRVDEFGTQPAAGLPYSVGIELSEPQNASCVDDRFDTWTSTDDADVRTHRNDAITDPVTTDLIRIAPTQLSPPEALAAMRICPSNPDFYSMSLTQGQAFQVDATYVDSLGRDIDIRVFGPDGSNTPDDADTQVDLLSCSTCSGVTGNERFVGTAPRTGTYFVEVFGFSAGENSYDLSVTLP